MHKKELRIPAITLQFCWPGGPIIWRKWLPSRGNVLFTLLVMGLFFWAQNAGAISLGAPMAAPTSTAGIPYQGRLADKNGAPLTQTVNMIFRLYSVTSGGTPLWEEQWTGANSVQVSDGLFNVMLGSLTPIPPAVITGNSNLFLGITVGTDSEMSPRVQLGSVPFATQALTVPDSSITTAKLADGSVTAAKLAPNLQQEVKRSFTPAVRSLNVDFTGGLHRWAASGTTRVNIAFKVPDDYKTGDLIIYEKFLEHDNAGVARMTRSIERYQKADGTGANLGTVNADYTFGTAFRSFTIVAGTFAAGDLILLVEERNGDDPADTAGRLDLLAIGVEYTGK